MAVRRLEKRILSTAIATLALLTASCGGSPAQAPAPPAAPVNIYESEEYGFTISYPEGWIETPSGNPGEIMSISAAEGLPSISISMPHVGEEITLEEFGPMIKEDLLLKWSGFELISEGGIILDDETPAYEIVFSGIMENYTITSKYVIVTRDTQAFFILGFSMPADFEKDKVAIDEVIHSFHLK